MHLYSQFYAIEKMLYRFVNVRLNCHVTFWRARYKSIPVYLVCKTRAANFNQVESIAFFYSVRLLAGSRLLARGSGSLKVYTHLSQELGVRKRGKTGWKD
jgi:hypothetical protein